MAKASAKSPLKTRTIIITSSIVVLAIILLGGAYTYGMYQGRALFAQNAQRSIVSALDAEASETNVDEIVTELDDAAKIQALVEAYEKEAATQEAAKKAEQPVKTETKKETVTEQPATKKVMRAVTLSNPLVSVETEAVVFSATLSETLVGDCKVFLQRVGDKAGAWHYNKSDTARNKCVTSIPRSQLAAGQWNYELTFMSDSVYGQGNPKGMFNL